MSATKSTDDEPVSNSPSTISITGLAAAAGSLVCACTLTGFVGGWFWMFEVTSHFRIQYTAILLVLAVGFLCAKRWRWGAVLLAFGLLNGWLLLPYMRVTEAQRATAGTTIKLLAWNVNSNNEDFEELSRLLAREEPDVVLLMEVSPRWERFLATGLPDYTHRRIAARDDNFGIALLGKLPLANARILYLGEAGVPSVHARLSVAGLNIEFLGTHPLPPAGSLRSRLRDEQLSSVAAWVNQQTNAVIIAGDLNVTPWSPIFRGFTETTKLKNSAEGRGLHGTWPAFFKPMIIPIDHFLHSPEVVVTRREILSANGSDHLPQVVELERAKQTANP
jgi:endonuclease/exonuclease/phosphatase (EEP) superfamily protein YafD